MTRFLAWVVVSTLASVLISCSDPKPKGVTSSATAPAVPTLTTEKVVLTCSSGNVKGYGFPLSNPIQGITHFQLIGCFKSYVNAEMLAELIEKVDQALREENKRNPFKTSDDVRAYSVSFILEVFSDHLSGEVIQANGQNTPHKVVMIPNPHT